MHKFLERLDASASTLVPLLYLAGLMLGAIAYFAGLTLNFELAVGIALASAAELHSFLQQRRARATYARLSRLTEDDAEYEVAKRQFRVNTGILIGLLIFSAFNATAFIIETWTPSPGPEWWIWLQYGVRGLVVPGLFFAAGFLVPLHLDASDQLRATSAEMLRRTLKAIDRQWRARLKRAEKRSADLAPVAIALLQEAGDMAGAKRIELIAGGLFKAEHNVPLAALTATATDAPAALDTPTAPHLPAVKSSSNGQNGQNGRLNNREKRAMLAAGLFGAKAHPTSPRDTGYGFADDNDDNEGDWANTTDLGNLGAEDFGAWDDDGPKFHMNQRSRSERAQAAHIAPRGAELAVREFVMPDLPPSKYEREDDTDQRRAVFRVLDQALANDKSLSRLEVAKLAGVSENTVRSARAIWETLRAADKKRKKAAPKTREMPAVTSDMLTNVTDALTTPR